MNSRQELKYQNMVSKQKNALYEAITFFINYKFYIKLRIKKIIELKNIKKNIVR
jgi:hypothetical protein